MTSYFKIGVLQILNILAYAAMILINGLADFLPINGQTTGEVSNQYPHMFLPASVTFSIWMVIYSLLLLFCIYQGSTLFEAEKKGIDKKERVAEMAGYLFIVSCLLNISWVFAWHYHLFLLTVILILGLLVTLIRLFIIFHQAHTYAGHKARWFVYAPFSVYLAWISVATIANIATWLVSIGWNGWNIYEWIWACVMIVAATILGMMMLLRRNNIFFAAVIVWALNGIMIRQYALSGGMNTVAITAMCGGVLLLLMIVLNMKIKAPVHKPTI